MILENEFTVGADVETVWRHLLDMEGVASCLPGASIEPGEEEGAYKGTMKVRMGPMTVEYRGTAKFAEIDESARTATISLSASEAKGQGTAMATLKNRLEPLDGRTRVIAETDLHITGPQAQFGKGVMEDVGGRVLADFAERLERKITGEGSGGGEGSAAGPQTGDDAGPEPESGQDALNLGSLISQSSLGRYARIGAVVLAALGLAVLLKRLLR